MGRRPKVVKEVKPRIQYIKGDHILDLSKSFVYEVEIYVLKPKSFNLEDSYMFKTERFKESGRRKNWIGKRVVYQDYKLIAAPLTWLHENRYNLLETDVQN